ncbi:MAG TPA: peptidoglycan DD-metalloendopeptidase family protein [Candidatus Paceibacterota bacterium]|nr:peptidoglycan DD-metalloendopeptidase family protein [Candidatus Paceibacterota bacterium]
MSADAQTNAIVPDASTPVLAAALNSDPDPDSAYDGNIQTNGDALVADSGPSGTIADVAGATASDRISVYVVRPGDTLSEIATMFGVSVNTIIWANDLKGATDVHPGDTLIILPVSGIKHTVAKGETLQSLAKKYGADAGEIAQYNGLDASVALEAGSSIIIPGGEIAAPAPVKSTGTKASGGKAIIEPYLGGSGAAQPGFFVNPLPGGLITQGIHGWNAVDIGAARGTPIYAAAGGTVIIARNNGAWNGGYGNYVVITHGNGTQTLYAHMTHSIVSPGQTVSAGETIGYVGATGQATGPHLHFEVRGAKNPFASCRVNSVCAPQ